jgi:hypothetical protein
MMEIFSKSVPSVSLFCLPREVEHCRLSDQSMHEVLATLMHEWSQKCAQSILRECGFEGYREDQIRFVGTSIAGPENSYGFNWNSLYFVPCLAF